LRAKSETTFAGGTVDSRISLSLNPGYAESTFVGRNVP